MAPDQLDLHHPDHDNYTRNNETAENADVSLDDFALESAIGDAFQQFGFVPEKKDNKEPDNDVANNNNNDEGDLEAAVGNAFSSLQSQLHSGYEDKTKHTQEIKEEYVKEEEAPQDQYQENKQSEQNYNDDNQDHNQDYNQNYNDHNQDYNQNYNDNQDYNHDYSDHSQDHNQEDNQQVNHDHHDNHNDGHYQHQDSGQYQDQDQNSGQYQDQHSGQYQYLYQHTESLVQEVDPYPLQAETSQDDQEAKEDEQAELDLETAIGNAFKSITDHQELPQETTEEHAETEPNSAHELLHNSHSPEDDKLENAIGEAFKSLSEYAEPHDEHEHHGHHEHFEQQNPHQEQNVQEELRQHQQTDASTRDQDLTAAITASFNEIMGNKQTDRRQSDVGLDLAGIVQNVVQQMAGSQDTEGGEKQKKEIPHLDENVLAHFQMEANKDEDIHEGSTLKNIMKAVAEDDQPEQDIEKLQMNEILQNAFSMAMLNPQELLTSLNDEEIKESSSRSQNLSTAAAIAALSMKKVLEKSDVSQEEKSTTDTTSESGKSKSLSIAETLALHRSSMSQAPRRDYSSIESLEESMRAEPQRLPTMNPQLSSILSSLSHHIQSGNQSQNLMLVIRQMTNALMLNKSSNVVSTVAQDLLQGAKSRPEERKFFLDSLLATKSFLTNENAPNIKSRAVTLIDNVVGLLNEAESTGEKSEPMQTYEGGLSDFYQSTLSTLSSFSNSRVRSILAGIKPKIDSSEYKEKIRIDNRERKKKWREENAERNKDNDLRSRVIKRANNMFGDESTPEKKAWVEEEFTKRREKRLAKQKKEEEKPLGTRATDSTDSKPLVSAYAEDPTLVKRVSDMFSLVAETGLDDDAQTILEATSAATAVAASTYAKSLGITDDKQVQSAVTQILTNVLDSTVRSGSFMRIPFLSKVHDLSNTSVSLQPENSELMSRLSSLTGGGSVTEGLKSALEILQSSRKRLGLEFLTSSFKKPHVELATGLFLEKDKSSMSRIESEIDKLRSSISSSSSGHLWSATNGLKMPQYKKPDTNNGSSDVKQEFPSPLLPRPSPFISNKIGLTGSGTSTANVGLRKPGSFQRPAYSKPTSKGNSSGFPTLYSPSFKLN